MATSPLLLQLLKAINAKQVVALATIVTAKQNFVNNLGYKALFNLHGLIVGNLNLDKELNDTIQVDIQQILKQTQPKLLTYADGNLKIFVEVHQSPPNLLIVGAGHIAQPLATLAKMIEFEVTVLDDRPQYANKQRFPSATQVIAAPFAKTLRKWPIDSNTYIVLVTRGHSHDVDCLLEIIDSPARYIGMVGSKRRIKGVFDLLTKEKGIPRQKFKRVYAPIGLDIGAETPTEIAICIIAEMIKIYRNGRSESLSDALRRNWRLPLHPDRNKMRLT